MSYRTDEPQNIHSDDTFFGVSDTVRAQILEALAQQDTQTVLDLVTHLHAADIADLINRLEPRYRSLFISVVKDTLDPQVIVDVDHALRHEILDVLSLPQIAQAILILDSDDAINLLEDLDEPLIHEILALIPAVDRATFERVLSYPEDSAGRLMQREVVCAPPHWTVKEVRTYIREHSTIPSFFYDIFIVDPRHHPIGKVPVNQLIRHDDEAKLGDIMIDKVESFPVYMDQEDVARTFRHYALVSAPVVSSSGRIIGMITVDDIVDVIQEEAEEDILHLHKVQGESDFYAAIPTTAYWRIRWLLITLANTLLASYVISRFEASIQQITALSFLMTINAAMGGNSGMQVVTVVVRALATKTLREGDQWRAVRKEVGVALLTGSFCSLLLGLVATLWMGSVGLGLVLSIALFINMLWAAFAGTLLPLIINRLNMDPAISAGPILTTTTDVFGYAIFLGLATLFLL
jgi:magnesium transporter